MLPLILLAHFMPECQVGCSDRKPIFYTFLTSISQKKWHGLLRNEWHGLLRNQWHGLLRNHWHGLLRNEWHGMVRNSHGIAPTLLKSRISKGERAYKHQFSDWLNTGFRIQAFTGKPLAKNEIMHIGQVVLNDDVLVRRLVVLGWDTLEIHGDEGNYGCRWQLKDYIQLPQNTI